jgi:transcriptional regulator with XRE-family HTH domain
MELTKELITAVDLRCRALTPTHLLCFSSRLLYCAAHAAITFQEGEHVTDEGGKRRRQRKYTSRRSENMALWVNEPLQNLIRDELTRREKSISDLAREIGSQPSLVSRWMQGQRPNTESLALLADALGLDVLRLLKLAGHIPADVMTDQDEDPRIASFIAMLRQAGRDRYLTEDRYQMLYTLMEWIRVTPPGTSTPPSAPLTTPGGAH